MGNPSSRSSMSPSLGWGGGGRKEVETAALLFLVVMVTWKCYEFTIINLVEMGLRDGY